MSDLDVSLIVNGKRYSGWKAVRITRSIESLAGSFTLDVSDRWGDQDEVWPIMEEDVCRVEIGPRGEVGQTVISGYIDKRSLSMTETSISLSYSGRDKAAAMIDCSATAQGATVEAKPGTAKVKDTTKHAKANVKWSYTNVDVADFTRAIAAPFGLLVTVQPGLTFPKIGKLAVNPGDTGWDTVKRVAEAAGVLLVSDGDGGILITRAGNARASALIQGFNVLSASVEYDGTNRFRRYLISSQVPGTDEASGESTRVQAEAADAGVKRADRVLLIRPDKGYNATEARKRADWEARIRAAKAQTVTVGVQGWTQPQGSVLWPLNAFTTVVIPRIGINGDMLISEVEYSIGQSGTATQLRLVRPDAFTPEPTAAVVSAGQPWLITRKGQFEEPAGTGGK